MRKNFILLALLVLLFILTPLTAWAILPSETRPDIGGYIVPHRPDQSGINILGQNHSYSVLFRGNGEAIVTARFIFSNLSEDSQSSFSLRIPRVDPKDVIVYQQIRQRNCIPYLSPQPYPDEFRQQVFPQESGPEPVMESSPIRVCANWEEPDYFGYNYYGGNDYRKLEFTKIGDELEIQLQNPIKPQKSAALLITYRAFGYTSKNILGGYNFVFESAKIQDKIYSLQVGISVDSDLLMRPDSGQINYYPQSGSGVTMEAPLMRKGAVSSTQLDNFYNQVGVGAVTKTASNLQPSESYSVKGTFADRSYKLYSREIFLGLAVILFILALLYICIKFFIRYYRNLVQKSMVSQKASRTKKVPITSINIPFPAAVPLVESLAVSFISSLIIIGTLIFYFTVFQSIRYNIFAGPTYGYYPQFPLQTLISVVIVICLVLFDLAVFAGSVALIWKRRGYSWGLITIFLNIFWLIFYSLIVLLIYILLSYRTNYYDYPVPTQIRSNPSIVRPEMMRDGPTQ